MYYGSVLVVPVDSGNSILQELQEPAGAALIRYQVNNGLLYVKGYDNEARSLITRVIKCVTKPLSSVIKLRAW